MSAEDDERRKSATARPRDPRRQTGRSDIPPRPPEVPRPMVRASDEQGPPATRQIWEAIADLRRQVKDLQHARAHDVSQIREEVDGMFDGVKAHVEHAVAPVRAEVRTVVDLIKKQDQREAERERIRLELKAEHEAEERRVQERVDRDLTRTGQLVEMRAKQVSLVDARIDGTRKHRIAKWTLVVSLLGLLVTLVIALIHSYAGPQGKP